LLGKNDDIAAQVDEIVSAGLTSGASVTRKIVGRGGEHYHVFDIHGILALSGGARVGLDCDIIAAAARKSDRARHRARLS
jgi:hypothetical protein